MSNMNMKRTPPLISGGSRQRDQLAAGGENVVVNQRIDEAMKNIMALKAEQKSATRPKMLPPLESSLNSGSLEETVDDNGMRVEESQETQ